MTGISIKNLSSYGKCGWTWTEEYEGEKHDCSTNGNGEGLWENDKQVLGTCQFHLPKTRAGAYSKIRRTIENRLKY